MGSELTAPGAAAPPQGLRWDLYCRVVDNFGDIGVAWRLARELVARNAADSVRLITDDASALAWMAPDAGTTAAVQAPAGADATAALGERLVPATRVQVLPWPGPPEAVCSADVVVEAFGCEPPAAAVQAMLARTASGAAAPVWINLEYLSAEDYVERSHALPSPQRNGLVRWFFFPGFTPRTGGLLREAGLLDERRRFGAAERAAWLAARGIVLRPGEQVLSLFCYEGAPVAPLLEAFCDAAEAPALVLATPGAATRAVAAWLGADTAKAPWATAAPAAWLGARRGLRALALPWLAQRDFDRLLWSSELVAVRGEDSLVRALWSGRPWLWQAYAQHDGAHAAKIEALAARLALPDAVRAAWRGWNGLAAWRGLPPWRAGGAWAAAAAAACDAQAGRPSLAEALHGFAVARRDGPGTSSAAG